MDFATELCAVVIGLAVAFITYFKWSYKYWEKKSVPFIEPSIPFGNGPNPFSPNDALFQTIKDTYDHCKSIGAKHGGAYLMNKPIYVPVAPDLIKCVLTKDFQNFMGHGNVINEKADPLSAHLFNLEGDRWKTMRTKLTPTFTSGKMKMMFQTLVNCGDQMIRHLDKLAVDRTPAGIKEILGCYSTDVIGSCAFGLECNSFKNPDAEFRKMGRNHFRPTLQRMFRLFATFSLPILHKFFTIRTMPKASSDFFIGVISKIVEYRQTNDVKRDDFVQILLEMSKTSKQKFTIEEMAAQAFVFFIAGFETSSTTMTFCLYELARDRNIQQKVREEIVEVSKKHGGKLTYDGILEMKYLDQVVNETLRKHPPATFIARVCNKDYIVPGTDVTVEKGTKVFISSLGLHRDPEYYPNPEEFDPERFSPENVATRHPYTYIPFGEGPRICIGLRFGLMQTKVGLSLLLTNYLVSLNAKTHIPLKMDPKSNILAVKGDVWLDLEKILP